MLPFVVTVTIALLLNCEQGKTAINILKSELEHKMSDEIVSLSEEELEMAISILRSESGYTDDEDSECDSTEEDETTPPRGRMSAYAFFVQSAHKEYTKEHPDEPLIFKDFTADCAKKWETMSDEEKKRFHDMANEDMLRYKTEKGSYQKHVEMRSDEKKQAKKPDVPKKALSAFFWYTNDIRDQMRVSYPNLSAGDMAKENARKWLECDPQTKKKYEEIAQRDRERYEQELREYDELKQNTVSSDPALEKIDHEDEEMDQHHEEMENCASSHEKKKRKIKAPRKPLSAFLCFTKYMRQEIWPNDQRLTWPEIAKEFYSYWLESDEETKLKYEKLSKKDRARYEEEMKRFREMIGKDEERYDEQTPNYERVPIVKRKNVKDYNAPKKPLSAFFWFSNDERSKVRAEHPDFYVCDVAKEMGRRWFECDPQTKEKYEAIAEKDRARYEREMSIYNEKMMSHEMDMKLKIDEKKTDDARNENE